VTYRPRTFLLWTKIFDFAAVEVCSLYQYHSRKSRSRSAKKQRLVAPSHPPSCQIIIIVFISDSFTHRRTQTTEHKRIDTHIQNINVRSSHQHTGTGKPKSVSVCVKIEAIQAYLFFSSHPQIITFQRCSVIVICKNVSNKTKSSWHWHIPEWS